MVAVIASRGIVPKADKSKVEFLKNIEEKWQKKWSEAKIFEADPNDKPKFFLTFPYPYINAYPHLGSAYTVLRVDIVARFKRMKGFNVLFPQGWHATGGPIVAAALRVREGDPKQINVLKMMGISEEDIPKFKDPEYWVRFFKVAWKNDFKRYGLSIDWRREFYTTYLNPPYSKFVQWQYTKLREKGLIVKGEHPVVWCPKERKVVGDHDRPDQYVGIGPEEVIIIKFKSDDGLVFPCLTYRPETVYGAVNVWVNPEAEYFVAEVDGERWVLGEYGLNELRDQGRRVEIKGRIVGKEVLGKYVTNPVRGWRVPVLPASFVDPQMGTGVVMSVPAHAPYDYAALKDLKEKPQLLEKYGLSPDIVKGVEPVSIIRLEEYGDYPAVKIVEEMGIKSQNDFEKLEEATKEIYTKEFHKGVLKDVFGKWAGRIVGEVKQEIIEDLVSKRVALRHYTLPSMVICRCGSKTHVKIVKDQWFIKYSDPQWKKLAHECIDTMVFLPEDIREYFHSQVNWYGDWACTHKGELGTPLPWDPEWVLESLSDSTIYMAYYTISKYLQHPEKYGIDWNRIDDDFFDYVFLGQGDVRKLSEKTGISVKLLEEMKKEFLYWYPVDLRISGKDLMPNHLVFFIMHHVAVFSKEKWPRGIGINGWVLVGGKKMSKSLGNFITLRQALEWWGADATRFAEAYAGDAGLDDANFEPEMADRAVDILYEWYNFAVSNYGKGRDSWLSVDYWFQSVLYRTVKEVEEEMEKTNFKTALVKGFFDLQNKFRWYLRRCGGTPNKELQNKFIEIQTLILAPFTPHIAEEIWEKLGKKGFASLAPWPQVDESKINPTAEKCEEIVRLVLEDASEILKVLKTKPKELCIVLPARWKYDFFKALAEKLERNYKIRDAISETMREFKSVKGVDRKVLSQIVGRIIRDPKPLSLLVDPAIEERTLKDALDFIEQELRLKAVLAREEEVKEPKARLAMPAKPALIFR